MHCLFRLMPAPARELIRGPFEVQKTAKKAADLGAISSDEDSFLLARNKELAISKDWVKAALRVATAATGLFVAINFGASVVSFLSLSSLISLPATLIAVGAICEYIGVAVIIASLALGSLSIFGKGLGMALAGWVVLECYRVAPLGIGEFLFDSIADAVKEPVRECLHTLACC